MLSGVLVAPAAWRQSSARLRGALWGLFGVFAAAGPLAERYPVLEVVQYAASAGLLATHLLNQRHCRCCAAGVICYALLVPARQAIILSFKSAL